MSKDLLKDFKVEKFPTIRGDAIDVIEDNYWVEWQVVAQFEVEDRNCLYWDPQDFGSGRIFKTYPIAFGSKRIATILRKMRKRAKYV